MYKIKLFSSFSPEDLETSVNDFLKNSGEDIEMIKPVFYEDYAHNFNICLIYFQNTANNKLSKDHPLSIGSEEIDALHVELEQKKATDSSPLANDRSELLFYISKQLNNLDNIFDKKSPLCEKSSQLMYVSSQGGVL